MTMIDAEATFQCPGEQYPISRSVHLARLAAFYPGCRNCVHRDEVGSLSRRQQKQLAETRLRCGQTDLFSGEGMVGVQLNELDAQTSFRAAAAFGSLLVEQTNGATQSPPEQTAKVVVARDGRPLTAELIEAASEGLRYAGCRVVDVGSATSGCLSAAMHSLDASGGLLVGNPTGNRQTVGLKFWGSGGVPLSASEGLDTLAHRFRANPPRPRRHYGKQERHPAEADYLDRYRPRFHALRPLRVALETMSGPLLWYAQQLTAGVACRLVKLDEVTPQAAEACHFQLWVDGDGESCRLRDERGQSVSHDRLLILLAAFLLSERGQLTAILEEDTAEACGKTLANLGVTVKTAPPARASMQRAMQQHGAALGGGASGHFWFANPRPACDALGVFALLLVILSQSDRPLSLVLDDDILAPS